jgi:DNA polymerase elongation subunit (family B)
MKYAKSPTEYAVLNKRQLAIKIMSNSCYGFMGSSNSGGLGHPELAAAVTAHGRDLIRGVALYIITTYPESQVVGGDTDSVYFTLPQDGNDLATSFKIGGEICKAMAKKYGAPIDLEMEKVYTPMVYLAKKTYAAIMYEAPLDKGKLDVKGMALVKGDSSTLTSKLQLDVIEVIMQTPLNAWPAVEALVKSAIASIKNIDKSVLVKSVKLGSSYKNPDSVTSVQVAKKMKARGQQEPQPGELVPYLVGTSMSSKVSSRADHPDFVLNLDYTYYIDAQIIKPLTRILDILNANWTESIIY